MKHCHTIFCLFALFLVLASGNLQGTEAAPRPDINNKSSPEKKLRDPFWPVGYIPFSPEEQNTNTTTSEAQWPSLKLKGITTTPRGGYLAIIDSVGLVEAGQVVQIKKNGIIYTWQITDITDKGFRSKKLTAVPAK
ncbi:MAG: hypothetical protein JXN60_07915 [Lentisphaerae bacterium]|nr:hypothetical protein [Lentisphaerota bacterium]